MPAVIAAETASGNAADGGDVWTCGPCGWEYHPAQGDPEHGVKPGTPWEDVPGDWQCPICGQGKDAFSKA
ncbi:MAG: rubredoxin [Alphaproteobacteria bacterium]|nr:rubredoxin [Alphaproteobacteria bacterium]MBF0249765.1 rubredoxin [Alphaproteobacteria bacterium]